MKLVAPIPFLLFVAHGFAQNCEPLVYSRQLLPLWHEDGQAPDPCQDVNGDGIFNLHDLLLSAPEVVLYELTVDVTWSEETHPNAYLEVENPHLSWLGYATHNDLVSFWNVGQLASPGIVQMAESGRTDIFEEEVRASELAGTAFETYTFRQHFSAPSTTTVTFRVSAGFPLVTFLSMVGPSGDWFVGTNGLSLRANGAWLDEVIFVLYPYDGGTRDSNLLVMGGPLTTPPDPIAINDWKPFGGISVGTFTFRKL